MMKVCLLSSAQSVTVGKRSDDGRAAGLVTRHGVIMMLAAQPTWLLVGRQRPRRASLMVCCQPVAECGSGGRAAGACRPDIEAGPYQQKHTLIGQITAFTLQIMALPSVYPEIT
jgi:hypothetical protein